MEYGKDGIREGWNIGFLMVEKNERTAGVSRRLL
jgi:hypothetical protein